jgi:polysaccharide chain length determinant protein (PEP-CTERM system associated)
MDKKQKKTILRYIDLVLKKRWFIIIPVCISMAIGIYLAITLPRTYQATTLILVESSKVPSSVVKPIQSEDIRQKINTISEQIMSQTYLDKIMAQYNLFSGPEHEKLFPEDKYRAMRENIEIDLSRSRGGIDAFKLSYKGKEPEKVKNVANALAKFFIDQSLEVILSGAVGTRKFLEGELQEIKRQLERHENELSEFKEKHMGRLPEQLNSNLSSLDRLQSSLEVREDALSEAKNRLVQIQNQLEETRRLRDLLIKERQERAAAANPKADEPEIEPVETISPEEARLQDLKEQYGLMLARYTEKHPDVIRLANSIQEIEKKLQANPPVSSEPAGTSVATSQLATDSLQQTGEGSELSSVIDEMIPERTELISQYNETRFEIRRYQEDIRKINEQIALFEKRVEETPRIEAQLQSIRRDYDNIKDTYESLLGRKLEAEISESMERQSKGTQFKILDYARTPQKPISPDMTLLFLVFAAAGFAIGGGIVFLFDFFDNTVRDPEEIEPMAGEETNLIVIPKIYTARERMVRYMNWCFSLIFMSLALCLFLGFVLLTTKGLDQTQAIIRQYVNI